MWSAPYTLDNVPITKYNINDGQGTLLDTVNTTEYILTSSNDDPCNETTVYVSGINVAGTMTIYGMCVWSSFLSLILINFLFQLHKLFQYKLY